MIVRMYGGPRTRAGAITLTVVALVVGGALLAVGMMLLLALAAAGAVAVIATLAYRKLTGRSSAPVVGLRAVWRENSPLDPALRVDPDEPAAKRLK